MELENSFTFAFVFMLFSLKKGLAVEVGLELGVGVRVEPDKDFVCNIAEKRDEALGLDDDVLS